MIYEKIKLAVDVGKLRHYFYQKVAHLPPAMMGPWFGGWSILSYLGTYTDGWQNGSACFKRDANGNTYFDWDLAAKMGFHIDREHTKPTELCTGYVLEVIEQIRALGLYPARARWSLLKAGGKSTLHRDDMDHNYAVRLHIPIVTNEKCTFRADGEWQHIPADGSVYLVRVNRLHQVFNESDKNRLHIIMNVWDTAGISEHHQMTEAQRQKFLQGGPAAPPAAQMA